MNLAEEQRASELLVGRRVKVSVGEPWDFESADGDNVLFGRLKEVRFQAPGADSGDQEVVLEVTPFARKGDPAISRLVAAARYEEPTGIIEQLLDGENPSVTFGYTARGPEGIERGG